MPNVEEAEALMGFPPGYTIDTAGINDDHTREQLLGNSMHVDVLCRILEDAPFANQDPPARHEGQDAGKETEADECVVVDSIKAVEATLDLKDQINAIQANKDELDWKTASETEPS